MRCSNEIGPPACALRGSHFSASDGSVSKSSIRSVMILDPIFRIRRVTSLIIGSQRFHRAGSGKAPRTDLTRVKRYPSCEQSTPLLRRVPVDFACITSLDYLVSPTVLRSHPASGKQKMNHLRPTHQEYLEPHLEVLYLT